MRYRISICTLLTLIAASTLSLAATPTAWKVGTAKAKITPRESMWLAGYGSRDKPAEGTLHDLWIKVIVFEDAEGQCGIVLTSDLLNIARAARDRICREVGERLGLPESRIMLTSSHTHTGPVLRPRAPAYPLDEKQQTLIEAYARWVEREMIATILKAHAERTPATLWAGEGLATFAVNRRNNPEREVPDLRQRGVALKGPVDHSVPVLAVRHPDGKLRAVLFGYACHCTVLNSYQWSGDYAGFAQLALEESHPGMMAMFWAGCGGDQNPLPRRSVDLAAEYGRRLATGVEQVLRDPMRPIRPTLKSAFKSVTLDYGPIPERGVWEERLRQEGRIARWAKLTLEQWDADKSIPRGYAYPIQTWLLGEEQLWIVLGGEVVVDYAHRLKQIYGSKTWVTAYANDVMAYIPSRRVWEEGGYESGALSVYGLPADGWAGDVEDRILRGVADLAHSLDASRFAAPPGPALVFLVSEDPDNYEAHKTIPPFAEMLRREYGFRCTVIQGEGDPGAFRFPGLEVVREADLLVVFFRRRALASDQLALIRSHLQAGKPLIGIRTANHAFSVRGDVPAGREAWWEFVPEVLGCENRGYGPAKPGTDVAVAPEADRHPILRNVAPSQWHSNGNLYLVKPLIDAQATVLLTGSVEDQVEPVAWTRMCGSSRVFYTSLGYPTDFEQPQFRRLLVNAIHWVLKQPVP